MPPLNLLIKPSSGMCSLNCTYCFYHDLMSKREVPSYGFMSEAVSYTHLDVYKRQLFTVSQLRGI